MKQAKAMAALCTKMASVGRPRERYGSSGDGNVAYFALFYGVPEEEVLPEEQVSGCGIGCCDPLAGRSFRDSLNFDGRENSPHAEIASSAELVWGLEMTAEEFRWFGFEERHFFPVRVLLAP
jgi:hypothetical protein